MDKNLEERLSKIEKQLNQFKTLIESLGKDVKRPIKAVRDGYYEAALTNAGSILENMLRDIWIREKISGNEHRKTIEQLFSVVKNTIAIDRLVEDYIRDIQLVRNRAAHGEAVIAEDTIEILRKLTSVLNWYFKKYGSAVKQKDDLDQVKGKEIEETEQLDSTQVDGKKKRKQLSLSNIKTIVKKLKFKKLFPKPVKIIFIVLILIYVVISLMSLINDWIYELKIEQVRAEYNTYYNNLFPINKTWLPDEWETRDCDAWDTYIKYFEARGKIEGNNPFYVAPIKNEYQKKLLACDREKIPQYLEKLNYGSINDLKKCVDEYELFLKSDELYKGLKCNRISHPYYRLDDDRLPNLLVFLTHFKMTALKIRSCYLSEQYNAGLELTNNSLYLLIDMLYTSNTTIEYLIYLACYKILIYESIPLILSNDFDLGCDDIKIYEKLSFIILDQLDDRLMLYRSYLEQCKTDNFEYLFDELDLTKIKYLLMRKVEFWKYSFSVKRYYYKTTFDLYKKMLEKVKYIRDKRNRSIFIGNFVSENVYKESLALPNFMIALLKFNVARTLGKAAIILLYYRKFGSESKEFLNLKGSDIFYNEFSGKKFEIITDNGNQFLVITEDLMINLKKIDYKKEYKDIIRNFNIKLFAVDIDQYKDLFYKFELQ